MNRVTKQYLKRKWPGDQRMHELIDYIASAVSVSYFYSNIEHKILQNEHGFTVGTAIRHTGTEWVKAQANNTVNAQTAGIISKIIDSDSFLIKTGGILEGPWTPGVEYFLSPSTPGLVAAETEVWKEGEVRQSLGWGTPFGLKIEIDVGDEIVVEELIVGPQGAQGQPGAQGAVGAQGVQGYQGEKGDQGYQGVAGQQGVAGPQGAPGVQGPAGAQGQTGPQGSPGSAGAQGVQGPAGVQGNQGYQGAQGYQGKDGSGVTIVGSVSTPADLPVSGHAGEGYITEDDGHLWIWTGASWNDVGLIRGPQGPVGTSGAQGAQGTNGAQGPAGAQGQTGPQGSPGSIGAQGVTGAQGPQGVAGTNATVSGGDAIHVSGGMVHLKPSKPENILSDLDIQNVRASMYMNFEYNSAIYKTTLGTLTDLAMFNARQLRGKIIDSNAPQAGDVYIFDGNKWVASPITGTQGPQGPQGAPGVQGVQGMRGYQGYQGAAGSQGPQGTPGTSGYGVESYSSMLGIGGWQYKLIHEATSTDPEKLSMVIGSVSLNGAAHSRFAYLIWTSYNGGSKQLNYHQLVSSLGSGIAVTVELYLGLTTVCVANQTGSQVRVSFTIIPSS